MPCLSGGLVSSVHRDPLAIRRGRKTVVRVWCRHLDGKRLKGRDTGAQPAAGASYRHCVCVPLLHCSTLL